eukprot:731275_1
MINHQHKTRISFTYMSHICSCVIVRNICSVSFTFPLHCLSKTSILIHTTKVFMQRIDITVHCIIICFLFQGHICIIFIQLFDYLIIILIIRHLKPWTQYLFHLYLLRP